MLQLSGEVLGVLEGAGARGEWPRLSVVEVRWLLDALGESLCGLMLSGGLGGLLATEAGVGGVRTGGVSRWVDRGEMRVGALLGVGWRGREAVGRGVEDRWRAEAAEGDELVWGLGV